MNATATAIAGAKNASVRESHETEHLKDLKLEHQLKVEEET